MHVLFEKIKWCYTGENEDEALKQERVLLSCVMDGVDGVHATKLP